MTKNGGVRMFSVALAMFCAISIGLALEKDKENGI